VDTYANGHCCHSSGNSYPGLCAPGELAGPRVTLAVLACGSATALTRLPPLRGWVKNRLRSQLKLEWRPEPGCHTDRAEPPREPVRPLLDRAVRFGADVLEEPEGDLAVRALGPAADDAAIGPDRRPDVATAVEERGAVRAQVPVARGPAHRGRVEGREERDPRLGFRYRFEVVRERDADDALKVDLGRAERGERLLGLARGPAGPPLQVGDRRWAERAQPAAGQFGARGIDVPLFQAAGDPVLEWMPVV